jgi:hypothetical protein
MKCIQVSTKQPICFLTKKNCIKPITNQLPQDPTTIHKFSRKRKEKMRDRLQGGKEIVHKKKTPIIV